MNYTSNLNKFESKLNTEVTKLFKLHDKGADIFELEEQETKVNELRKIVESLKILSEM